MNLTTLKKRAIKMTSPQYQAARLAIKGLSHVLIANELGVSATTAGTLIEEAEALLGEALPRAYVRPKEGREPRDDAEKAKFARRAAIRDRLPDVEVAPGTYETCGYCGLRWHSEDNADGSIGCDLKARRLQQAYIGSALGAE